MKQVAVLAVLAGLIALWGVPAHAVDPDARLKPYVLASVSEGPAEAVMETVKPALAEQGFEVVGDYVPYDGATVLVVTSEETRSLAAKSEFGGYGAAQRVSITEVEGQVQVAYTNPVYMANVYRMAGDLEGVAEKLAAALGRERDFGSEKGIPAKKLRKYHYMIMMPYFDDHSLLAEHGSHQEAVTAVEAALQAGKGGTTRIYRVDVPGKDEVVFGVAVKDGEGADTAVIGTTDVGDLKHTAYMPYELLVSGNKAYALHGKFRIALSFPDLKMGTFMKISGAPKGIKAALEQAAGG